jgi:hypothetical protein
MKIEFSQHAREGISERQILEEWVIRAILQPKLVWPHPEDEELKSYFVEIPENENRVLRVVFNEASARVVTAYFDRTMRGKL